MIKIGFLRYFNEENTILACLKSHNYCDYIFCFTHLPRNGVKIDKSTEIIENYIKENNLQDKIFLIKYNEVVYICNLFKKNSTLLLSTVCMDDLLTTQAITEQPNEDMKTLATVALGSPHLMRKEKKENDHA